MTASADETARIWDADERRARSTTLRGPPSRVTSAAFSPDGARVVTASCGQDGADLGRRQRAQPLATLRGTTASV